MSTFNIIGYNLEQCSMNSKYITCVVMILFILFVVFHNDVAVIACHLIVSFKIIGGKCDIM